MGGRFRRRSPADHAGNSAVVVAEVGRIALSSDTHAPSGRPRWRSGGGAENADAGRDGRSARRVPQHCWWVPRLGCGGMHSAGGNGPYPGVAVCVAERPLQPQHQSGRSGSSAPLQTEFAFAPGRLPRSRTTLQETCAPHAVHARPDTPTTRPACAVRQRSGSRPDEGRACGTAVGLPERYGPRPSRATEGAAAQPSGAGRSCCSVRRWWPHRVASA
jgi:hypothetical protein